MTTDAAAAAAAPPEIDDEEIRTWAKSTGRQVGDRGKVPAKIRAEYLEQAGLIGAGVDAPPPPAGGSQKAADRPRAARAETRPRPLPKPPSGWRARVQGWVSGSAPAAAADGKSGSARAARPKGEKGEKASRPRTTLTRLVETGWEGLADLFEHTNLPVARAMAWQSPYMGIVADDVINGTPVDRILQPIARLQESASGLGAMIAMPIVVGLMTAQRNDPEIYGLPAEARQQFLARTLDQCIDAQIEMFAGRDLAGKILASAEIRQARREEVDAVKAMIFTQIKEPTPFADPNAPTSEEVARAQAEMAAAADAERGRREAASAIALMRKMQVDGPDLRGQAAEQAASNAAFHAAAAAAAQDAAVRASVAAHPATGPGGAVILGG